MKTQSLKNWPVLALSALLFTFLVLPAGQAGAQEKWVAPPEAAGYQNPLKGDSETVAAGKKVFLQYCVVCHGDNGDGKGPTSLSLQVKPANFTKKSEMEKTDGGIAWKILTGRGVMPSWAPILSEDQVWQVVHYIRTFGK